MKKRSAALDRNWQSSKQELVFAAHNAGIDPGLVVKIAGFESGFNPNARPIGRDAASNRVPQFDGTMAISSAYGYGQFIDGTWASMVRQYGTKYGVKNAVNLTNDQANSAVLRSNTALQAAMLAEFTRENMQKGAKLGGVDPDANVYAFHNLGDADATRFLAAMRRDPDARVDSVLPAKVIRGNPVLYDDGSRTLAEAYAVMGSHMGRYEGYALQVASSMRSIQSGGRHREMSMSGPAVAATSGAQVVKPGDNGTTVRHIQQQLHDLGYAGPQGHPLKIDGDFGRNTDYAVRAFQQAHGLHVDGIVGNDTREALAKAERTPLLSEKNHPNYPLFHEAQQGLRQLPPGTFRNGEGLNNTAAALAQKAGESGISRIDHVLMNTRGDSVIAVQGNLQDPARNFVAVDKAQAASQSIEQSTVRLAGHAANLQQQDAQHTHMQHMEHRAGLAIGMRP